MFSKLFRLNLKVTSRKRIGSVIAFNCREKVLSSLRYGCESDSKMRVSNSSGMRSMVGSLDVSEREDRGGKALLLPRSTTDIDTEILRAPRRIVQILDWACSKELKYLRWLSDSSCFRQRDWSLGKLKARLNETSTRDFGLELTS